MIQYIDHIVVYVTDMGKSLNFYTEQLGLPLKSKSEYWSEVGGKGNGVYIGLHSTDKVDNGETTDIVFRVDDIEQAKDHLEAKGVEFYDKITEISPGSWFTSFTDPDGNKLSIYQSKK